MCAFFADPKPAIREMTEFATGKDLKTIGNDFLEKQHGCAHLKNNWFIVMTDNEVQLCVRYVAYELNQRFVGKPIVLCAILKGAYVFLSDLTKHLTIPYTTYFVEASSYGDSQIQGDKVQLLSQIVPSKFHNRHVILVDELFDHGKTMHDISNCLIENTALKITRDHLFTVTALQKHSESKLAPPLLVGMKELPAIWLVGFGLDDNGEKRGWPHIFACPKAPGIARVAADDAFGDGAVATAAFLALRAPILKRLTEIKSILDAANV